MKIKLKNIESFKELLMKKGSTQRLLAENVGVSENYISLVLNGKTVGPKTSKKICEFLNVGFDEIFLVENLTKVS